MSAREPSYQMGDRRYMERQCSKEHYELVLHEYFAEAPWFKEMLRLGITQNRIPSTRQKQSYKCNQETRHGIGRHDQARSLHDHCNRVVGLFRFLEVREVGNVGRALRA